MEVLRDNHHFFYNRADCHQRPLNLLRGLVIARSVLVVAHKELHANLPPPPLPNRPLAHNIVNHLSQQTFRHPLDAAFETVDYLMTIKTPESLPLAEHIGEQIGYLVGSYE